MSTLPPLAGRLAALALLCAAPASAAPLITEFLTNNNTGILDEDATRQDWIEIYNPDALPVDLGGYHLTDDVAQPTRWTFPAGVNLNPGAYLVVFASGKNRTVPGQNLHTNFSLSSGGEYLALNSPGGTPALTEWNPAFPVQSGDISYGLLTPVAGSASGFFTVPTPGAANNSANSPAETVQFSVPSKTFNQGTTFPVALSTLSGTATIRFTLNRAMPIDVAGVAPSVTVDAATDVWTTAAAHTLKDGDQVQVHGTTVPGGIGLGLHYYVILLSATTFKLADDPGGPAVDVTSAGATVHIRRHAAQWTQAGTGTTIPIPNHKFYTGDAVQVATTGTLPTPLVAGTTYYVLNNFVFSTNLSNIALSATPYGAAISITGIGSGVQTMFRLASPVASSPITIDHSLRLRARSFQAGRPDGAPVSTSYLMLDASAQTYTSNIPVMILHGFGSGHPSTTAANPEDSKEDVWFTFEPKPEGTPPTVTMVTRLTNPPDLVSPGYFERRGSSTFGAAKYSMTMGANNELGEGGDVSPLGFASNDDFVLNAHFQFDRSLMHNDLAFRLSRESGQWAPETRHVEVFMSVGNDVLAAGGIPAYGVINGLVSSGSPDYYGIYSFQDKVSRGNNRLDIEKLEPFHNTAPEVQGGYVFKIDRLDIGDTGVGGAGRSFALVQPKERMTAPASLLVATTPQKTYLTNTLNAMQTALNGTNFMSPTLGYAAHLDVPAAVDHWWLSILPKSADAFRLSGFWHKSRFGKLVMGPVFDFDRAMGSTDGRDLLPTTWRGDNGDLGTDYFHSAGIYSPNYFQRMFDDPNYWQATIDRYEELRRSVLSTAHVHAIVNEWTEMMDPGNGANTPAKRNGTRWTAAGGGPRGAAANTPGTDGTFRGEATWLKNWWGKAGAVTANGRFDFVDGQFMRPPTGSLPGGPVPAGSNITLSSTSQSISGVKIYYTTDGTDPRAPATAPLTLYSPGAASTIATLLPDISPVRAIVPTSATTGGATGVEWRGIDTNSNGNNADDFDDTGWFANAAGTINGVGYDNDIATSYLPSIGIRWSSGTGTGTGALIVPPNNTTNTMFGTNGSCFLRLPFTLSAADIALITTSGNRLMLGMRFDDAFVAYVNGTRVTNSANVSAGADNVLWNSTNGSSLEAVLPPLAATEFEITASVALFHAGTNILAIQGLNGSSNTSSDFLMQSRLYVVGPAGARPAYTPSLTAGATEFTTPLPINVPTQIFARTLHPQLASDPPTAAGGGTGVVPNGSSWSGPTRLYYFPGAVAASQASIQITEVHYHPAPPTADEITLGWLNSNDFEFIRLTNTGAAPVDLTGIYFSNGLEFTAVPGLQNWLPAGASVVVVENTAAFISRYGTSFTILGEFNGELDDGGEHIVLNDKTGAVISDFIYGDGSGPGDNWPTAPDNGYSLIYVAGNQNLPASWRVSLDPGGTVVDTFARWQRRYFDTATIPSEGLGANTDGDPLNNLGEYAFATDPRTPGSREASAGTAVAAVPPRLSVIRRTGTTDLTWSFEISSDLTPGAWTPTGAAPVSVINLGNGTESATWEAPVIPGATRLYLRVSVTSP